MSHSLTLRKSTGQKGGDPPPFSSFINGRLSYASPPALGSSSQLPANLTACLQLARDVLQTSAQLAAKGYETHRRVPFCALSISQAVLKGSVSRDFRPPFFHERTHLGP